MPAVETRYAAGLLSAAKDPEEAGRAGAELEEFDLAVKNNPELKYFMFNPVVPAKAKKEAIKRLFNGEASVLAENFLCLLVDKGRLTNLSGVIPEYNRMRAGLEGVLTITVTSSEPLDERRLDEISALYREKYGAVSARIENRVDTALLGGVRVRIGDTIVDDSLSARLRGLASAIGAINF